MRNGVVLLYNNRKGHVFGLKFLTVRRNSLGIFQQVYKLQYLNGTIVIILFSCQITIGTINCLRIALACAAIFNSLLYSLSFILRNANQCTHCSSFRLNSCFFISVHEGNFGEIVSANNTLYISI
jgi:hypothetical protein